MRTTNPNYEECHNVNKDRRQTPITSHAVSKEGHKVYQIRVKGHLDSSWSEWFEGLTIAYEADGITVLTGLLADQPALHGLLIKIRDLGLPLVSVNHVEPDSKEALGK
jgi:hypothetical protein